jgi:hypothetical protein
VETKDSRSSDRIYLELPIILTGTDAAGRRFTEETKTLVVNRRGAKIVSRHSLAPNQKLRIRCLKTDRESDLRVVGNIGGDAEGYHYGIEVINAGTDFWGINFPMLTPGAKAASRVLLECTLCRSHEVAHLSVFDLEVLLANECLMRLCGRCKASTYWMPPAPGGEPPAASKLPSLSRPPIDERKDPRINLRVDVCIRHPVQGEEVTFTENVSRGGFRFRSSRDYPIATLLEAALPYVPGAANIFTPVRIVFREENPTQAAKAYGVAYLPTQVASSLTGMRILTPE